MSLSALLQEHKERILDDAQTAVHRSHLQAYEKIDPDEVRSRLEQLLTLVTTAVEERNVRELLKYMSRVGEERYYSGTDLSEVQTAVNVLEETLWKHILRDMSPAEYPEALGLISTVLGWSKDTLARKYVELASQRKARSLDLHSWQ
jgi:hypothetical protein